MEIISEFVREQKRYAKNDLKKIFRLPQNDVDDFTRNLKAFGILKAVKNNSEQRELSDLIDLDVEVSDVGNETDDYLYVFTYVGVVTIGSRVIKCYPKYLLSKKSPLEEMKQVLKVISRYSSKEQVINLYNGDAENSSFNLLAVILFLLNDYYEYGVYNNTEDIVEVNGEGEIIWNKTVNEAFSLICDNRPYYLELYTRKNVDNERDFIKRLHECILTECSKQLEISGLFDLFEIAPVELSEEARDDLGDEDYILYRIQAELNIQFNTRKQILLKTVYSYIKYKRTLEGAFGMSMYGTNNFNLIWEDVCSEVLSNKLHYYLGQLQLPLPLKEGYRANDKLIDIIQKPIWSGIKPDGGNFDKPAKDTIVPDIITIYQREGTYQFIILDAKYYNLQLEEDKQLRGQPGVGDVAKQYLYQRAYNTFLDDYGIQEVRNCFLMPTEGDAIIAKGFVKMDILGSLGLQDIQIRQLPAKIMYSYYLNRKTMDISKLNL